MSECRFCEKPVEVSLRTGKPKLYCSKKCANGWHQRHSAKRYIKKNPDWGARSERDRLLKEKKEKEREKKNAWIDKNCISKPDLAKELGVHAHTLWNRMRILGIKTHKKVVKAEKNTVTYVFVNKKHVKRIKKYKGKSYKAEAPEGYISKSDAAEFLGVTETAIVTKLQRLKEKTGVYPVRRMYAAEVKHGTTGMRCFYNLEDLKKVPAKQMKVICVCPVCKENFKAQRERIYCSIHCKFKEARDRRAAEIRRRGLITQSEAIDKVGCSVSWPKFAKETVKVGGRKYIKENKVKKLAKEYEVHKKRKPYDPVVRRTDNWQHWEVREKKLLRGFPAKVKRWEEKWGSGSKEVNVLLRAIDVNHSHHGIMEVTGQVAEFACSCCSTLKPFYEFNFSSRGKTASTETGRRTSHCRQCTSDRQKAKRNSSLIKQKRQENYQQRMKCGVGGSIKRHISKVTGKYCDLSVPSIWLHIEKVCGYGHLDLVKHTESQFTSNMHWQNQKTPKLPGEYGWHLDHIEPHVEFGYDSLDHPDFAACWALENLRPLEAIMNMQKGDKKLYQAFQNSFRTGIKKAQNGEVYTKGVWKHLDYGNLEAKKNLDKKLSSDGGMTWENWGSVWQLDHIDPTAHLSYLSPRCNNFKNCWNLDNLTPLLRKRNASKGSRWENRIWFHNH